MSKQQLPSNNIALFDNSHQIEVFHSLETKYTVFNLYHQTKQQKRLIRRIKNVNIDLLKLIKKKQFLQDQIKIHGISFVFDLPGNYDNWMGDLNRGLSLLIGQDVIIKIFVPPNPTFKTTY